LWNFTQRTWKAGGVWSKPTPKKRKVTNTIFEGHTEMTCDKFSRGGGGVGGGGNNYQTLRNRKLPGQTKRQILGGLRQMVVGLGRIPQKGFFLWDLKNFICFKYIPTHL